MPFSALNPPPVKPHKLHEKTMDKIMIAARLEINNLGMTDDLIALHLGVRVAVFRRLKKVKIYQQIKSQLMTGVIASLDDEINNNYQINKRRLASAVPTALENLIALASQKLDKSLQLKASQDLLDREGSFAKISRANVTVQDKPAASSPEDDAVAGEILQSVRNKTNAQTTMQTIDNDPLTDKVQ